MSGKSPHAGALVQHTSAAVASFRSEALAALLLAHVKTKALFFGRREQRMPGLVEMPACRSTEPGSVATIFQHLPRREVVQRLSLS